MKKTIAILLLCCLVFATACGGASSASGGDASASASLADASLNEAEGKRALGPTFLDFSGLEDGFSGLGLAFGMSPEEIAEMYPDASEYEQSNSANGKINVGFTTAYGGVWEALFMFNGDRELREIIYMLQTEEDAEKLAEYGEAEALLAADDTSSPATRAAMAVMDKYKDLTYEYKHLGDPTYIWKLEDGTRVSCSFRLTPEAAKKSVVDISNPAELADVQINFIVK